jgi:hypothetical protein
MAIPTVTVVTPDGGPNGGGTTVLINGTGFTGAVKVFFGDFLSPLFNVLSDTQITCLTPFNNGNALSVRVRVQNADGISSPSVNFAYGYAPSNPTFAASESHIAYDEQYVNQTTGALSAGIGYAPDIPVATLTPAQRIGGTSFNIKYSNPMP